MTSLSKIGNPEEISWSPEEDARLAAALRDPQSPESKMWRDGIEESHEPCMRILNDAMSADALTADDLGFRCNC